MGQSFGSAAGLPPGVSLAQELQRIEHAEEKISSAAGPTESFSGFAVIHYLRGITESEFRDLYRQYRDPLFRFGYRLTGSAEVAEDLVHDCFVGLFRGAFDEQRGSIETYLYSSLRNLCRKHYRDSGREQLTDEAEEASAAATTGGALDALISREIAEAIQCAVAALPLLQREALVLFEYEGLALDRISKIVDADVGAVKSRLHRARTTLRRLLPAMKETAR